VAAAAAFAEAELAVDGMFMWTAETKANGSDNHTLI
jgi:hypothetical protein